MALEGKALHDINEADLQELIDNKRPESVTLDYKTMLAVDTEHQKKEFVKDVCAFANTAGGHLVYGVREKDRIPLELIGVEPPDPGEEQRLLNIIRDRMEPTVHGCGVHLVELKSGKAAVGKAAVIVRVPKSFYPPHSVVSGKDRQFYTRSGSNSYPLDVPGLRALFVGSETLTERIRNWRAERLGRIAGGETPRPLVDGPKAVLHVIPFTAASASRAYDLSRLIQGSRHTLVPIGHNEGYETRPNYDGLLTGDCGIDTARGYVQVFRGGSVESVGAGWHVQVFRGAPVESGSAGPADRGDNRPHPCIALIPFEFHIAQALERYLSALRVLGAEAPVAVGVSLLGVKGMGLRTKEREEDSSLALVDRNDLVLPAELVETLEASATQVLRPTFDVLWNAAGHESSPSYDADGRFLGQKRREGWWGEM